MANTLEINIQQKLGNLIKDRGKEIEAWFAGVSHNTPPFFYNSVDLRNAGFKLAPVDTNLFPAGFNNLIAEERKSAVNIAKDFLHKNYPNVKKILIIAENHTRNTFYLDNLVVLSKILTDADNEVQITNLNTSRLGKNDEFESRSGHKLTFKPIKKDGNLIKTLCGFVPDMIVINNDMTEGSPEILHNIKQPVSPPTGLGWYKRRKTAHFETYNNLVRDFCHQFEIDPWLISTYFTKCGVVNFKERKGLECVALNVEKTLVKIRKKYDEYGIKDEPYVFVKSDRGTYGMGIMTAKSGQEILDMNKNIRKKMNAIKGGEINTEVIIQEGVPTIDKVHDNPAEPMIYMMGGRAVGCIYRLNTKKDNLGNLNASGMEFASISEHNNDSSMCESYALIARLAAYASAWECYTESYSI